MPVMVLVEEAEAVRNEVVQLASIAGFSIYPEDERIIVKYKLPYRRGMPLPFKQEYKIIAEIDLRLESGGYLIWVEPMVFGDLRPKVDLLVASLKKMETEDLKIQIKW